MPISTPKYKILLCQIFLKRFLSAEFLLNLDFGPKVGFTIGPLKLAIHVVQNRRAGEQTSLWDKTNKWNNLKIM